ncbi:MAG TPA: hypothetical protein VFS60_14200 [Thermoanaerobaculia bacterium]|nr:hypothetical protein [Thermoanaerobaculia bacterium]
MTLAAAASALRQRIGAPLAPAGREALEAALGPARGSLPRDEAEGHWRRGLSLPLAAAVRLARGDS